MHCLARAAEYKDKDTGAHIRRIDQYSVSIAHQLGLSNVDVGNIMYAAPMHDVGEIGIPDCILFKPGNLERREWEIVKQHTIIGAHILHGSDAEFIKVAEVVALTHHEKWDGTGYPQGLKGSSPDGEKHVRKCNAEGVIKLRHQLAKPPISDIVLKCVKVISKNLWTTNTVSG